MKIIVDADITSPTRPRTSIRPKSHAKTTISRMTIS